MSEVSSDSNRSPARGKVSSMFIVLDFFEINSELIVDTFLVR